MNQHRPDIPLPIVPDAEEPVTPGPSPIVVDESLEAPPARRPPAKPLVCPLREPSLPTPREFSSSTSREPTPRDILLQTSRELSAHDTLVSWKWPVDATARPNREIKQESVPSCASQPSNLRRSTRSNLGHIPNRLVQDRSDTINVGKGPSNEAAANLVSSFEESSSVAPHSNTITNDSPCLAPHSNSIADVFLVADQPGLAAIYSLNGITQPYAFKTSKSDPDTLSYDEAMADVDCEG